MAVGVDGAAAVPLSDIGCQPPGDIDRAWVYQEQTGLVLWLRTHMCLGIQWPTTVPNRHQPRRVSKWHDRALQVYGGTDSGDLGGRRRE